MLEIKGHFYKRNLHTVTEWGERGNPLFHIYACILLIMYYFQKQVHEKLSMSTCVIVKTFCGNSNFKIYWIKTELNQQVYHLRRFL
jgi:hypothetical protein